MQKIICFAFIFLSINVFAQNLQLHYDYGHSIYDELGERAPLTTTAEMFKADKVGSTYFFADFDYDSGVKGAYWEVSRNLCFWPNSKINWLSVQVEYDGGMNIDAGSFNDAWLLGATYSGHNEDFSATWSLSLMYKHISSTYDTKGKKQCNNFQVTGVWNFDIAQRWITFSGFFDFWRECRPWQNTTHIFLSEPQLWLNMNKFDCLKKVNLSVGGEIELSNNFVGKGFYAIPTTAIKFTF